jgi:hypothetical protein
MWPGLMAFTRMRRSRSSLVQVRAKDRTAAFVACGWCGSSGGGETRDYQRAKLHLSFPPSKSPSSLGLYRLRGRQEIKLPSTWRGNRYTVSNRNLKGGRRLSCCSFAGFASCGILSACNARSPRPQHSPRLRFGAGCTIVLFLVFKAAAGARHRRDRTRLWTRCKRRSEN